MGSTTREVVTLQIGHYSNFIGTHWWNLQVCLIVPVDYNHNACSFSLFIYIQPPLSGVFFVQFVAADYKVICFIFESKQAKSFSPFYLTKNYDNVGCSVHP